LWNSSIDIAIKGGGGGNAASGSCASQVCAAHCCDAWLLLLLLPTAYRSGRAPLFSDDGSTPRALLDNAPLVWARLLADALIKVCPRNLGFPRRLRLRGQQPAGAGPPQSRGQGHAQPAGGRRSNAFLPLPGSSFSERLLVRWGPAACAADAPPAPMAALLQQSCRLDTAASAAAAAAAAAG
jgi:hypothetical protein